MIALVGSEKQVAWAEKIRESYVAALERVNACYISGEEDVENKGMVGARMLQGLTEKNIIRERAQYMRSTENASIDEFNKVFYGSVAEKAKEIIETVDSASWWISHK